MKNKDKRIITDDFKKKKGKTGNQSIRNIQIKHIKILLQRKLIN